MDQPVKNKIKINIKRLLKNPDREKVNACGSKRMYADKYCLVPWQ